MNRTDVAVYERASIPGGEIQDAVDEALAEVLNDPASQSELREYGLDEEALQSVKFLVEQEPGTDPGTVVTLISIAAGGQLTAEAIKALWGMVLRRVRKHKGDDALGTER